MSPTLPSALPIVLAVAASAWFVLLVAAIVARRRHARRRKRLRSAPPDAHELTSVLEPVGRYRGLASARALAVLSSADHPNSQEFLEHALTSEDAEIRRAAVAGLGHLGSTHDWAVDGLITALTTGADAPARVAAQIDRLAPRPGTRLVALLSHPDATIRFWAVRLLAPYSGGLAEDRLIALLDDPEPSVRAGSLSGLRVASSGDALRGALALLNDEEPRVRTHACRTVADLGGARMAPFLVPLLGDPSWWVRQSAHDALKRLGPQVEEAVAAHAETDDVAVRTGVMVLLDDLHDTTSADDDRGDASVGGGAGLDWPDDIALVGGLR